MEGVGKSLEFSPNTARADGGQCAQQPEGGGDERALLTERTDLALQLERLERKLINSVNLLREHDDTLQAHESQIEALIEAINAIRAPATQAKRPLGFRADED